MTTSTRRQLIVCGLVIFTAAWCSLPVFAQSEQRGSNQVVAMDQTPAFRITVVDRTTKAVNYHFRSGATKVDLKGTELMPGATGTARVDGHLGRTGLDVKVNNLESAQKFGTEYLTYVLWAITPEGRASNLGEFVPGDDDRKISVTTDLQAFGLIVTAEPYFGVTQPSNLVVMENFVRPDTVGASEYIDAKYELMGKGQYIPKRSAYAPLVLDPKVPIYLHEARNAVRIAQLAGAEQYAAESFGKAATLLQQAEDYQARKKPEQKPIATVAREAVQSAEDARLITMRRREEEYAAGERQAGVDREARATAKANAESEAARRAREEAERARNAQAKAEADSAQARADSARAAALAQQQVANAETERLRIAAEAERLRLKSEAEKAQLRAQLLQQLNAILATRDTARGLVINMADVLFETAKSTLRPVARERLSKIAGIVIANRDLRLIAEGHTDSVGGDAYNQNLSEQRAGAVRDYLAQQGVPIASMTSQGFGKTQPVASNDSAAGRQLNRRVELVVSGETIGGSAIAPAGGQN